MMDRVDPQNLYCLFVTIADQIPQHSIESTAKKAFNKISGKNINNFIEFCFENDIDISDSTLKSYPILALKLLKA